MKISLPQASAKHRYSAPIELERSEKKELRKGEYIALKLRTVPTDDNSQTYELSIPYFSTGTPEEWLKFQRDFNRVVVGQGLTTGPTRYQMMRRLLEGDALAKFNTVAQELGNETLNNFQTCVQ